MNNVTPRKKQRRERGKKYGSDPMSVPHISTPELIRKTIQQSKINNQLSLSPIFDRKGGKEVGVEVEKVVEEEETLQENIQPKLPTESKKRAKVIPRRGGLKKPKTFSAHVTSKNISITKVLGTSTANTK